MAEGKQCDLRCVGYDKYHKHRDMFFPSWYNSPKIQHDVKYGIKKVRYNTQDPLYLDQRTKHLTGGVKLVSHVILANRPNEA